ncbi:MAG: hypothetical protein JJT94_15005 [Bernardetiaceae bacterium]|nr:hypothetical protein [Bernardetiaceae bacterium]
MQIFKFLHVVILLCFFSFSAVAQEKVQDVEKDKKEVEKFIYEFADEYSKVGLSKKKEKVMEYVSKDLTSTLVTFNVAGRGSTKADNYQGFSNFLDRVVRTPGLKVSYKITDILRNHVSGDVAVLVYMVNLEIMQNEETLSRGNETVLMSLRRNKENKWLITHYSIVGIEDEKIRGACLCELFKASSGANSGHFVVKTIVPSGQNYTTNLNTFEFSYSVENAGSDRLITVDNNMYRWTRDGKVLVIKNKEDAGTNIAESHPTDEIDVIVTILKYHLYKDNCTSIKIRSK